MTPFEPQTSAPSQACPLCGDVAASRPTFIAFGRTIHHCPACDLLFVAAHEHIAISQERARYATHQNTIDNVGYVSRFERLMDRVAELAKGPLRVVDFGCGPGPVLVELLRRRGHDAVGYDPFFAPDADLSRPFDSVFCTETAEHFRQPSQSFEHLTSLVKPGGSLAMMTLFHPGPASVRQWWYVRDETHVSFYSLRTFEWIARRWGFTLEATDHREIVVLRRNLHDSALPAHSTGDRSH